jgi:hypothetical protein
MQEKLTKICCVLQMVISNYDYYCSVFFGGGAGGEREKLKLNAFFWLFSRDGIFY